MTRIIFTLLLLALPISGHCLQDTNAFGFKEKNIHGKISCYTYHDKKCHGVLDFYADGFEIGTEFELVCRRCDDLEISFGTVTVTEDGWLSSDNDSVGTRFIINCAIGEPLVFAFVSNDEKEYKYPVILFPLCFKDDRGHLAALWFLDPKLSTWVVDYKGYEDGEIISHDLVSHRRKIHLPEREASSSCKELLYPAFTKKKGGSCVVTVYSHTKKNKFTYKFGWGPRFLIDPSLDWLLEQRNHGLLCADVKPANQLVPRSKEGLTPCGIEALENILLRKDGYSIERAVISDYRLDRHAKVVLSVPPGYKPLQRLDAGILEFIPEEDEDPYRWSEIITILYYPIKELTGDQLMTDMINGMIKEDEGQVLFEERTQEEDLHCVNCAVVYTYKGRNEIVVNRGVTGPEGGCSVQYSITVDPKVDVKEQVEVARQKLDELFSIVRT